MACHERCANGETPGQGNQTIYMPPKCGHSGEEVDHSKTSVLRNMKGSQIAAFSGSGS